MDRHRDRSVMDRDAQRHEEKYPYSRGRHEARDRESVDREGYTREPDWDRDRYGRGGGYGQGSAGGYNEQHTSDYRSDYAGEDRWRPGREFGEHGRGGSDWGREDRQYGESMRGGRGGGTGSQEDRGRWEGSSQYDRGGWGSSNFQQTQGGGTRSAGTGYEGGYGSDRGQGSEFGRGSSGEARQEWSRGYGGQQHSGTSGGYGMGSSAQGRFTQGNYGGVGTREWSREYEPERESRGFLGQQERDWNQDTRDRGQSSGGVMESIGRFFGFGPKNYRRSDERITEELNDRLYRHPDIDASDIDVSVKDGEVTLSGTVDSRRAKFMAEDLADEVLGIKDVNNQLRVRKQTDSRSGWGMTSPTTPMGTSTQMGTTTSSATTGTGTTLGQSQTGTTRDIGETSKKNR